MRVLKSADPRDWKLAVKCLTCESELELELSDLTKSHQRGCWPGEADSWLYGYDCAVCRARGYLPETLLPSGLKHLVKSVGGCSMYDR
jgi:hypothetical protein